MSADTLKKLVLALIVLVLLWGGVTFLSGRGEAHTATGAIAAVFQGVGPDSVTSVLMARPADTVVLQRSGSRWTVDGWTADSAAVAQLFKTLGASRVGDLASTNPANQARMGVAADSAWTLTLDVGGKPRTLLVGGVGPRYGTAYVRMPGEDDVYLLEGDLRSRMDRSVNDWRNKNVARVDTAAVRRIEVEREGDTYALVRGDSAWTVAQGGAAKASPVQSLLAELSDVRADGFLAAGDSVARLPEAASVVALGASGDTLATVRIGAGGATRWARTPGDSVTYEMASWVVDRLAPKKGAVAGGR